MVASMVPVAVAHLATVLFVAPLTSPWQLLPPPAEGPHTVWPGQMAVSNQVSGSV